MDVVTIRRVIMAWIADEARRSLGHPGPGPGPTPLYKRARAHRAGDRGPDAYVQEPLK